MRAAVAFALALAAVTALAAWLGLRHLDEPGLYYDEGIQAVPARDFLRAGERPVALPLTWRTLVAGRWLPVLTQPYMGALKSQLLIPAFAAFGASVESLRATTFAWGLVGLCLSMLFARRLLGAPVAVVAGLLLAVDPAFLFVSRHDWGSFSLGLVCRCGGLWLVAIGFARRSAALLGAAGLLLGLGVYNKLDFAAVLAAAACAIALVAPRSVLESLRRRPREAAALACGLALGAAPLALGGPRIARYLTSTLGARGELASDLPRKLTTWATLFDGSHFHRLMLAGGRFDAVASVEGAVAGLFLPALGASVAYLGARLALERPWGRSQRAEAFALATLALAVALLLAIPRAERIHHVLNVYPFPQLVVASALVRLGSAEGRSVGRAALRALAALGLAAVVAGQVRADLRTLAEIRDRGGRGLWSHAVEELARELAAGPAGPVVSLDWGFQVQLGFLAPELDLREPFWALRGPLPGTGWVLEGTPGTVYLVHDPRYRIFPIGDELLAAVARLPPGVATVRRHPDRGGETAFLSVRIARPHRLVRREVVEVVLH